MTLTRSGREIADYFSLARGSDPPSEPGGAPLRPRYNLAPSQDVLAVRLDAEAGRVAEWRRWGLVPSWARDVTIGARLFNARSETAEVKPSFRQAFRRRRCLVAADGFYEWTPRDRGHQPYHFRARDGGPLALAGLYEEWHGPGGEVVDSCTVLTAEASEDVRFVHPRMPVVLRPSAFEPWLDPASSVERAKALLSPPRAGLLEAIAVSRAVNDARRDDPRCLEPAPSAGQGGLFERSG
jgi:putative SOS response-associated peptidase YedK